MQLDSPPVRKKRLVSMTPLIDVVFILLLFFMLVSNFQQRQAMSLNLTGQNDSQVALEPIFSVHIGREGGLLLDDRPVELENLTAKLERQVAGGADPRILIETDASTHLQTLVQVIDRITAAGIHRITLGSALP